MFTSYFWCTLSLLFETNFFDLLCYRTKLDSYATSSPPLEALRSSFGVR